jgi:hypothetical protein
VEPGQFLADGLTAAASQQILDDHSQLLKITRPNLGQIIEHVNLHSWD